MKKNPISIERELDKERAIFINENERICKKRDDIDTDIIEYEKDIHEKIYEIKIKIIDKQEKIKNYKSKLNEIKLKNLEDRKEILKLLNDQKQNRIKNNQEIKEIKSLILKKKEKIYKYQTNLSNIPELKREFLIKNQNNTPFTTMNFSQNKEKFGHTFL